MTDADTSIIHKLSMQGESLAAVHVAEVKAGGLAGITVGPDHKIYFVDRLANRVLRLDSEL